MPGTIKDVIEIALKPAIKRELVNYLTAQRRNHTDWRLYKVEYYFLAIATLKYIDDFGAVQRVF